MILFLVYYSCEVRFTGAVTAYWVAAASVRQPAALTAAVVATQADSISTTRDFTATRDGL
jgi:hypothetical protein